jgi:hypothetical protein
MDLCNFFSSRQERSSQAMAKPFDTRTDKELEGTLAERGLTERKAAVAEEILRRRQDAKSGALKEKHGWMGLLVAAFAFALFSLKRFLRKRSDN